MIMCTKANGWTKNAVIDAIEARTGIRLPKSAISITCSAKEMQWAKEEAHREYRGGVVFCIAGFGDIPDAIIYAERDYDYAPLFVTQILIRANRVSTILIDEIADTIF